MQTINNQKTGFSAEIVRNPWITRDSLSKRTLGDHYSRNAAITAAATRSKHNTNLIIDVCYLAANGPVTLWEVKCSYSRGERLETMVATA